MRKGYEPPMIPPRGDRFRIVMMENETHMIPQRGLKYKEIIVFTGNGVLWK